MLDTYNVAELRLGNQTLGLRANEFLFKLNDLGTLRLLVLQLGNLIGDLCTVSMSSMILGFCCTLALWSRLG